MKLILTIILSAIIIYLVQSYFSIWWLFAVVAFVVALGIKLSSGWQHFICGLLPVFGIWMYLYYRADKLNDSVLSTKIADLFSMPNHHVLFIVCSLIMGLIGGIAAVAGGSLRKTNDP